MFTLPAWAPDDERPIDLAIAVRGTLGAHPALVVGRDADTRSRPRPRYCSAVSSVACASSPMTGDLGRAVQAACLDVPPGAARTAWRPAASPTALPSPAPVGRPTLASRGRPSSSSIQAPATCSAAAAAGEGAWTTAFWPQAVVSQSAAAEAGSARRPRTRSSAGRPTATRPGSGAGRSSITATGHRSVLGSSPPKPLADGRGIGARADVAVREAVQVVEAELRATPQGSAPVSSIVHRPILHAGDQAPSTAIS